MLTCLRCGAALAALELHVQNAGRACDEWLRAPEVFAAHDTKSTTDTNARQRHGENFGVRNFAETGVLETRGLALDILRNNRLGAKLGDRRRIGLAAPALGFYLSEAMSQGLSKSSPNPSKCFKFLVASCAP